MMVSRKFFVVAGPQAAGKTTAIIHLSEKYTNSVPMLTRTEKGKVLPPYEVMSLEESRALIVHKYQVKGAVFMTELDELEVIHNDMTRMFKILRNEDRGEMYIDECNVFTLAHAKAHGIDLLDGYYRQYCDMLRKLDARFIFLEVAPEISWERRRERYRQRHWDLPPAEREEVMKRHEDYLFALYPELLKIYEGLDFPKVRINSNVSLPETLDLVEKGFSELLE